MKNVIVNKNTKNTQKEEIMKLFSKAKAGEKNLSDGEIIIVHNEESPKIAILTPSSVEGQEPQVKFIGDGVTKPADESLIMETDPDTREKGLKVQIWKDKSEKPEEEKTKNALSLIPGGGLFVPEIKVTDVGGVDISLIPEMQKSIVETQGNIDVLSQSISGLRGEVGKTNESVRTVNEKIKDGVVNSVEAAGDDFISVTDSGNPAKPSFKVASNTVSVKDAKPAGEKTDKVDGLATALDVKDVIENLVINGVKIVDNPVFSGEIIKTSESSLESEDDSSLKNNDTVAQALMKLQNMVQNTSYVLSAALNNMNNRIARLDVITGNTDVICPGNVYKYNLTDPEQKLVLNMFNIDNGTIGFFRLLLDIACEGGFPVKNIEFQGIAEGKKLLFPEGYNTESLLENGKLYYIEVITEWKEDPFCKIEKYR